MMTIKQQQQFADEWKKVSTVVESEARRQLLTIGHLDYTILNNILRDERSLWFRKNTVRHQWLESFDDNGEVDKMKVAMKIRQAYLQDIYRLGNKSVRMIGLRFLYLLLSIFVGFLVCLATDLCFSPTMQEYLDSPLKWIVFPLLTTVLVYTFCLPYINGRRKKRIEKIIMILNEEMEKKEYEILAFHEHR